MKARRDVVRLGEPLRDVRLARARAVSRVDDIEQRIREREMESFEKGRLEGEKALREQLLRQRSELVELQNGVLASLRQAVPQVIRESEQAMVALALEIAGRIVADAPISSECVEASVREALAQVEDQSAVTVFLHPMDFELLQQANSPRRLTDSTGATIRIETSPKVSRGGCLVQTRFGMIDARRETKLEAMRQTLGTPCN